jgi:O-acetyl-ADP-ribose deacetylase (regulator of RNase III)
METKLKFNGKIIYIKQGDITDSDAEAIVNAANNHLWMGAGVAGAIKRKGGKSIEEAATQQGPVEVGEAVVTHAGKLKTRYVIHAAVMGQDLRTDADLIKKTTMNTLNQAEKHGIQSIEFPALGTGVGGFPLKECASLMITETYRFLQKSPVVKTVGFALFDISGYNSFCAILNTFKSGK